MDSAATAPNSAGSAGTSHSGAGQLTDSDYQTLAELRADMRSYLAWAEQRAKEQELTPTQVQLALAVRAHANPEGPTITQLAETLQLRHHSAVGLVDRTEQAGMVERRRDKSNASIVHVVLTDAGAIQLEKLTKLHLEWLREHGGDLAAAFSSFS